MVLVTKNYGEIRLCVDFRYLDHASDKDNYPIPPMEKILQMVLGSKLFSLVDGFLGYNQVLVAEQYRLNTKFCRKWGNFIYWRIPFGLINARASFQREMDIDFQGLIGHSVVVYLEEDRSSYVSSKTNF